MLMSYIIIGLLSLSIFLFIVSFFLKDRYKYLEKEIEDVSMNYLQENYQLKKRMKVLEEELMLNGRQPFHQVKQTAKIHEVVKNQVIALYNQGITVEQIAKQSALSKSDVLQIISNL
jgi:hypothetical protein